MLHKTIFEIEVPIGYFNYYAIKNRQAHSTAKIKLYQQQQPQTLEQGTENLETGFSPN